MPQNDGFCYYWFSIDFNLEFFWILCIGFNLRLSHALIIADDTMPSWNSNTTDCNVRIELLCLLSYNIFSMPESLFNHSSHWWISIDILQMRHPLYHFLLLLIFLKLALLFSKLKFIVIFFLLHLLKKPLLFFHFSLHLLRNSSSAT